jgi:hypothetical protein
MAEIIELTEFNRQAQINADNAAWARYGRAMEALKQASAEARRAARLLIESGAPKRGPDVIVEYAEEPSLPGPLPDASA